MKGTSVLHRLGLSVEAPVLVPVDEGREVPSLVILLVLDLQHVFDYPVGVRLSLFSNRWGGLLGPVRTASVIADGVLLGFWKLPQLSTRPVSVPL